MLLDTCTLLWLAADQASLSKPARSLIAANAGNLFISAITALEIAVKHRKGSLVLPCPPGEWIAAALDHHGVADLPVDWRIAERSASLPPLHKDPADRIIVATAQTTGLPILSPDEKIRAYPGVTVLW